ERHVIALRTDDFRENLHVGGYIGNRHPHLTMRVKKAFDTSIIVEFNDTSSTRNPSQSSPQPPQWPDSQFRQSTIAANSRPQAAWPCLAIRRQSSDARW